MSNTFKDTTKLWLIDETGTLNAGGVEVVKVVYFPSVAADDLILTDNADNEAIILKAGASDASPVQLDFGNKGRKLPSLKVGTLDGGTANIYFRIM